MSRKCYWMLWLNLFKSHLGQILPYAHVKKLISLEEISTPNLPTSYIPLSKFHRVVLDSTSATDYPSEFVINNEVADFIIATFCKLCDWAVKQNDSNPTSRTSHHVPCASNTTTLFLRCFRTTCVCYTEKLWKLSAHLSSNYEYTYCSLMWWPEWNLCPSKSYITHT